MVVDLVVMVKRVGVLFLFGFIGFVVDVHWSAVAVVASDRREGVRMLVGRVVLWVLERVGRWVGHSACRRLRRPDSRLSCFDARRLRTEAVVVSAVLSRCDSTLLVYDDSLRQRCGRRRRVGWRTSVELPTRRSACFER